MPNRIGHGSNVKYLTRKKSLWITVHPEVCLIEIHTTNKYCFRQYEQWKVTHKIG